MPASALYCRTTTAVAAALLVACGGGGDGATPPATESAPVTSTLQPAPSHLSGNVSCRDLEIGALSLDTVTVPDGASCRLVGTRLVGSIKVGRNASVEAVDVAVNGDLQANGAAHVELSGTSSIGGSVQIKQGDSATVLDARITGDLQLDAMRGDVRLADNRVDGSTQAVGNRGGLTITGNRMIGNLQCKENQPAPTGGGNTAASKEDQCAAL